MNKSQLTRFYKRLGLVFLIGLILIGVGYMNKFATSKTPIESSLDKLLRVARPFGAEDAPVDVVLATLYDCPKCSAVSQEMIPKLMEEYVGSGKVRLHLIEVGNSGTPGVRLAHRATECADEMGKFMEMRSIIYEKQSEWRDESRPIDFFLGYGEEVGLEEERFVSCLNSDVHDKSLSKRYEVVKSFGIKQFPSIIVGRTKLDGMSLRYAKVAEAIESELKEDGP